MIQIQLKAVQLPSTQNIDKIVKTRSKFRGQISNIWQGQGGTSIEALSQDKTDTPNYSHQLDKDFHLQVY
jgi:hypothetical protein